MRLKRVKIYGFKTFADRVEFDLDGGLVAVTGPNGCGKSNLVDAILWGLGQTSAKALRAGSGSEVIFSGSQRRKPIGYAEVTLLFDNDDGSLPIPHPEVSVTRRVTRAGESEYLINKQACRLRDVHELLADSGLGRSGYAIVGQKEIDQALSASAEDRRAWIDEAAGVQRYRTRKVESLRKLSQAQLHLSRVQDIVTELENQREPLREEAEAALRYRAIMESLQSVESALLATELAKAVGECARLEVASAEARKLSAKETALADSLESQAAQVYGQARTVQHEIERTREAESAAKLEAERATGAIRMGEAKLENLSRIEDNLGEEASLTEALLQEADHDLVAARAAHEEELSQFEETKAQCAGAGSEAEQLRSELKDAEKALSNEREKLIARQRLEAELAHASSRMKEIRRELRGIENTADQFLPGLKEAEENVAVLQDALTQNSALQVIETAKLKQFDQQREEREHARRQLLAQCSATEARMQGLQASIAAHEGLQQGARVVLELVGQGRLEAEYEPVGEALTVPPEYAVAIEVALGGAVNDLIVPDEGAIRNAIQILKAERLGRATFQALTLVRPQVPNDEFKRLLLQPGVIGRASELVECRPGVRPVFEALLGRILIVETLDDALRLAKTGGWNRLVTLDGEFVHNSGSVTGGNAAKGGYGLIQRRADLAVLEKDLAKAQRELQSTDAKSAKASAERETLQEAIGALIAARKGILEEAEEANRWLQSLRQEQAGTDREKSRLERELLALQGREADLAEAPDIEAAEKRRDEALMALAARSADAESASARLKELEARLQAAKLTLERAESKRRNVLTQAEVRQRKQTNLGPEKASTERAVLEAKTKLEEAEQMVVQCHNELEKLQARAEQLEGERQQKTDAVAAARAAARAHDEVAHESELQRARAEGKKGSLLQRLADDYAKTEDEALEEAKTAEVPADAATLVARLRREARSMGDVNLGAIEAYERLSTRHDELAGQQADLLASIEQLEQVVSELDKRTRHRFEETFVQVREAFQRIFLRLFDGGEADLSLTLPNNMLETGIEIDVTLPGKRKQRLELLSGGERSLCATAFLFALLQVRPSPLVVLDEVDAPLDGRNVERFVQLIREFANIQFIVITHNPTTIESAPIWLGVTMAEPGVSTLVPAKVGYAVAAALV